MDESAAGFVDLICMVEAWGKGSEGHRSGTKNTKEKRYRPGWSEGEARVFIVYPMPFCNPPSSRKGPHNWYTRAHNCWLLFRC